MKAFLRNIIIAFLVLAGIYIPVKTSFSQNKKVINPAIQLKSRPATPPKPKRQPSKENLAISYYYGGDYEKAAELFRELYNKQPRYNYYRFYYNSLIKIKNFKDAEKLCKKQIKLSPDSYRFKIDLAYVYMVEGNKKKADKIINKIIVNLPDNRNIVSNIAISLQSRGFYEQAVTVYDIAKKKNLGNYNYNMELARAYRYAGDYERMFDAYIEQVNINPQDIVNVENQIQNLLIMDVNDNLAGIFKKKLLTKAQQDPSNPAYAELLMWFSLQIKDFDLALRQAKSIDRRFRNQEEKLLDVADVAYSNGDYETAVKACEYLLKKKKNNPYFAETYEKYFKARLKLAEESPVAQDNKTWEGLNKIGERAIEEVGFNGSAEIVKDLAHIKAFRLNKPKEAITLLDKGLVHAVTSREKALLKMEKADILAFTGKFWDASLLYAQVEDMMKNEPLGYEAKFRNARLFYYKGEFQWAKTRLDVLKGSTSKLIANDALELSLFIKDMLEVDTLGLILRMFAGADQYAFQQKYDSALVFLNKVEEEEVLPAYREYVLYKKGEIFEKQKKYNDADSVYTYLYENYPESIKADNAIFRDAEINRLYLNNQDKAKRLYLKLMKDYPDSIYATEARKIYRNTEGEENGST